MRRDDANWEQRAAASDAVQGGKPKGLKIGTVLRCV